MTSQRLVEEFARWLWERDLDRAPDDSPVWRSASRIPDNYLNEAAVFLAGELGQRLQHGGQKLQSHERDSYEVEAERLGQLIDDQSDEIAEALDEVDRLRDEITDRANVETDLRAQLAEEKAAVTAVRMAPVALALLADAWRHLRLDTPEDQELHQRLLDQTDATIRAALKALAPP